MQYRKIGNSGLNISEVSLGTMNILRNGSHSEKLDLFSAAADHGINYFDTADNYESGAAEVFLGDLLNKIDRNKILIGTKCYFPKSTSVLQKGLSRKNIVQSIESSLKRLKTEYIDILFCHRFDTETPLEETLLAIQDLIRSGKVLYWGVSAYSPFRLCETFYTAKENCVPTPIVAQYAYNLFNRTIEMELTEVIQNLQIGVIGYYPLAQGVLTGKYTQGIPSESRASDESLRKSIWDYAEQKIELAKKFAALAELNNCSPSTLAIQWCQKNPLVCSTLTNANTHAQLAELISETSILNCELAEQIEQLFNNKPLNPFTGKFY